MAKKAKDTTAAPKKAPKAPAAPSDPAKTRDLIRLLNTLALLLAIAAFLLQLFAVLSHHWKWQATSLGPLISPTYHYSQANVRNDSRLDQQYGLYSREVKLYANSDEQLDLWASTRFPRSDDDDDNEHSLNHCLSQTSTLRGAYLTCSPGVVSAEQCHCRRYRYWSFVIFFEILALILLGIALLLTALITTQYHGILKPAAAGLSIVAFLLLLIGLILILSHLKRETRSIADTYPHIHQRLSEKLGHAHGPHRGIRTKQTILHQAIRRQTHDIYRAYPLLPGQHPYNETHYQEFSEQTRGWVYKPYSAISVQPAAYAPLSQRGRQPYTAGPRRTTTAAPLRNSYGPLLSYDAVYNNTRAGIGWSTVLSILSMIPALLLPLILIFSWLTQKKLSAPTKTTTTTTSVKTEYVPLPQDAPVVGPIPARPIPTNYDHNRPVTDAVVTAQHVRQTPYDSQDVRNEPFIVRDVVIRDDHPVVQPTQEHSFPVNVDSHQTAYQT